MSKTSATFAVLLLAACAGAPRLVDVPDKLKPSAGESLAMVVSAKGVQIYECRARKEMTGGYEWVFLAPEAELFDARGNRVGKHYAGPRWEANDGSKILGSVKERADPPAAGAIPWLLLAAKSDGPEGAFSGFTSVQRVNTVGGAAPGASCDAAASSRQVRVAYTADYYFFSRR
jgi:hypothetical protein